MMDWDETDLISAFETLPTYEDEGTPTVIFTREAGGIRLTLLVWPYHGEVAVTLHASGAEQPVFESGLIPCQMIRRVRGVDGSEMVEAFGEEGCWVLTLLPRLHVGRRVL